MTSRKPHAMEAGDMFHDQGHIRAVPASRFDVDMVSGENATAVLAELAREDINAPGGLIMELADTDPALALAGR